MTSRLLREARRSVARLRGRAPGSPAAEPASITIDPDRCISAADYARRTGSRWQVVRPAEEPAHHPARRFGSREGVFDATTRRVPDVGVLWLDEGIIVNLFGLVVSREGELILDTSGLRDRPHDIPIGRRSGTVRQVKGTVISIATNNAHGNYGHFMLDGIPRIRLLEQAGVSLADADKVICNSPGSKADRLLESLGIDPARRIRPAAGVAIQAEHAIVTTMPGISTAYQPWIVEFLRDRLAVPAGDATRRLWIPRTGHRRIMNEAELLPILEEHGFETYVPHSTADDPRRVFAEAAIVVGGHGAGLTDIAFCRPGTAVLELMSEAHVRAYYLTLAQSAGLRYGYLIGPSVPSSTTGQPAKLDYTIDPDEFRDALAATVSGT
jgi:hypothetical protein